jgi:FkbH-like protein
MCIEQFSWLPAHPDLAGAIKSVRAEHDLYRRAASAVELAGYRRDFVMTDKLDRVLSEIPDKVRVLAQVGAQRTPVRIALLSSHTVDHLAPAIRVAGLGRRLVPELYVAPYGLYRQVLLGPDPALTEFSPQFILLALDAHEVRFDLPIDAREADVAAAIDARISDLRQLWRNARDRYAAKVVQQTLIPAAPPIFGSFEGLVPASPFALTERLNAAIRTAAGQDNVLLLDLAWYASRYRRETGIADPVRWHQAKQLVSPVLAPLYGDLVARIVAACLGLSRKCLVLDLDNTLWGGLIGDDGLDGIRLGQGEPAGEAFLAFQHYAAALSRRGIILAVCSKNNPEIAEHAFSSHPEMALRREDIASFIANWEDKPSNLRRIARQLNLGLDSMVFVDDNPAERDIVRRELPDVAVPELPEDVALYPIRLAEAGYFEAAAFTGDDALRNRSYRANVERQSMLERATDMEGYLKSLSMTLVAARISEIDLGRAAQLINKSNQFNLTTRRYTEAELERLVKDPAIVALCFRLRDRFGDNGLISVILARTDPQWNEDALLIDTWLMSCRVLGRQVESAALEVIAGEAAKRGASAIIGEYRPTPRNGLVADHFAKLGFARIDTHGPGVDGATYWHFDIAAASHPPHFITIERL